MPCRSSRSSASARRSTGGREQPRGERPAALGRRRPGGARAREPARPPVGDRRAVAPRRAQRRPGVVRHLAGPDELPQRRQRRLGVEPRRREQVGPELGRARRARREAPAPPRPRAAARRPARRAAARRSGSRARRGRGRPRPRRPRRSRRARRARRAGSPGTRRRSTSLSHSETGSGSACSGTSASRRLARRSIPCQAGRKRPSAACSAGSTSLRSAASEARRRRRRTSGSHHSRSMPPGRSSPRTSLSARSRPARMASTAARLERVARGRLGGRERPARAREAREQHAERVGHGLEERLRQAAGRHHAERVAEQPGVLDRDQPLLAGDPHPQRAPLGLEHGRVRRVDLVVAEIAAAPEQVVQLVGRARVARELRLDLGERLRIEQVAQLLLPEQLAEQVAVERERLRPPLGRGRVVLVHVGRDVGEEQRRGERRRRRRLDLDEIELARLEAVEDPLQRRQVEDVLQALAVGLEHDRERAVVARDLEQALRLQPLLPQRRALARAAAAGSGARGRRSRGSGRRTARSAPPPGRRAPRSRRA